MTHRLRPLLEPRSIALIGASDQAGRIGGMALDLLRHFRYAGEIFPVNPKYAEVFGYRCYPDIESVPAAPDLAVLALGAEAVAPMLERCHAHGARAAIVYAAGFAEMGGRGQELQDQLATFARRTGMIIAGPNCMGLANLNTAAYTAFAGIFKTVTPQTSAGRVSLVAQSGNVCSALFGLLRGRNVTVSHFITTGNEAALEFSEYLEFLAQDPQTESVVGYVEQLRDGARFIDTALRFAEQRKPLIIYKVGQTERGAAAVRSHTSALAGDMAVYRAAFRQLNVIHARDLAQMADLAYLSGFRQRTGGTRIAVVTISGAIGAILADELIEVGVELPELPEELQHALRSDIPDYGMVANPVDVTGDIINSPDLVKSVFDCLAATDAVDAVVVNAPGFMLDRMADALVDVCARHERLFVVIDTGASKAREKLERSGVPVFGEVGRAVQAIGPWCRWLARGPATKEWALLRQRSRLSTPQVALPSRLNESETKRLLRARGVPAMPQFVAGSADEAVGAAQTLGWPVVLKILSADIPHKTEVGGVKLDLGDAASLRAACTTMLEEVKRRAPGATIEGFLLEPMAKDGVAELIAGVTDDPVFGRVLTVGLGGVLTELYRDASHRLLPVDSQMVNEMLKELKAWPLLDGFRGRAVADVAAACSAVEGLSRSAMSFGNQTQAVEINPLLVRPAGMGAVALDALLIPSEPSRLSMAPNGTRDA